MDFNLDVRLKQLESLEHYISSSRDKVQSVLDCLKWNDKEVLKENQLIKCSIDPNHRVHSKSVEEHVKNCLLRKEGYDLNEDFLSEPVDNASSCITIDDHKKIEILSTAHRSIPNFKSAWNGQDPDPLTANRLLCTFSPDERLTLYTYAATNTIGPPKLPEFNTAKPSISSDRLLNYGELRMRERDSKRRRIKYKSVHTNRKSQLEVLKEVIDGQMEMYTEWLTDNGNIELEIKNNLETEMENSTTNILGVKSEYEQNCEERQRTTHSEREQSVVSKNSNHSGSSRSTKGKRHSKDRYEYDRHKRYDDRHYRKHRDDSSHNRQSRERHDYRKHRRSHSRNDRSERNHYDGYGER